MTVEELLQLPTIKGLKLISGNLGVHREISTVTVVDTPDGFQWLKGNEVVIKRPMPWKRRLMLFLISSASCCQEISVH